MVPVEDLRPIALFDGLAESQLAELAEAGTAVPIEPGVELFREGERADYWWVLIEGAVDLIRHGGRDDVVVGRMDVPGRWAGGFRAWDEHGVYLASGRGAVTGRVLQVPAAVLGERCDAWFPFGAHLVRGLYGTARSIEATARQRESLVALGTLAAGFAHEVNNPAAAAARAARDLEETCQDLVSSVARLAATGTPAEQLPALDQLRGEIEPAAVPQGPLAMADREDALSTWLTDHGVARDWVLAPLLAAAGADVAWCERAAALLPGAALEPGLEWVASATSVTTLLAEVQESTRRVSELVGAVRSYTQMDRGSIQRIDVADGIESTLMMLGRRLAGGIDVVRRYGSDVPRIDAYAGELNRVWTNVIDNALDAMDGGGTLHVATRADGDHVVVEIGDTGHGMTPDVAARAFQAFFTTKPVGKGTGLGLDIARRIVVERHGGSIDIDSRPGRTVLRVRLPLRLGAEPPGADGKDT